ncbi:hypothetical protein ACRS52_02490 [Bacillus cytotoxicus]|uniref:ATP-binding protein n=1 Tax=Bacillus cytotoxicus TaxID=580165 RepID=A0AAX2CD74_9BACI|nr:hypothetical protein [Bacillus cytotoxicus]QTR83239.1 hypothetical protein JC777_01290 [Bacillus cytotoxicus]QTR86977.1 hypothetical protein JC774_21310 [Bacillus cytotoxicus]SCL85853.1 Uncharacterized protein BCB44BAC_00840 [Bacillus cytotoxicus]
MKQLLLQLLYTQTEEELKQIIDSHPQLRNPNNWHPYGGGRGNYSAFENQQSTAMGALVEKFTNALDAVLTRRCYELNIDPASAEAPQTMQEAVEMLFDAKEGYQAQIKVFTDGKDEQVNVISMDNGEGQLPTRFPETLLSLQRGNKNNIKFVQGKYNMGSTGAAVFCGKYKYQLYISKRHMALEPDNNKVGFTIVRKHERTKEELEQFKNTWYEYLVIDEDIPYFELNKDESIEIVKGVADSAFNHGTVIKMYNYALPSKSQSFQALKADINRLLYYPALPIHVYETRDKFLAVRQRKGSVMNIAYGNGHILRKKLENTKPIYESIGNKIEDALFGTAIMDLYVFDIKKMLRKFVGKHLLYF